MSRTKSRTIDLTDPRTLRPTDDSKRQLTNKNYTDEVPRSDDPESAHRHADKYFSEVLARFDPDNGYGIQNLNSSGVVHPYGLLSKTNRSLAMIAIQATAVLAMRASMASVRGATDTLTEHGSPQSAKKFLSIISQFVNSRTKKERERRDNEVRAKMASDLGVEPQEIVAAPKTSKKKSRAKATSHSGNA